MENEIINKVAGSGLLTLDLEDYFPKQQIAVFDLKNHLFMELILKEKDFRAALQSHDWSQYTGKIVAVTCTADAIIPLWAYMLVATYLEPVAHDIYFGDEKNALQQAFLKTLNGLDTTPFVDQRVIVKGCGDIGVGEFAYLEITRKLRPVARSIMYGEACSTVPIYKKR